jgi:hypothetical protein
MKRQMSLRNLISMSKNYMTAEERGRLLYEREATNWPKPLGWDNLSEGSKAQWEERARCIKKLHEHTRSGYRDNDTQQGQSV